MAKPVLSQDTHLPPGAFSLVDLALEARALTIRRGFRLLFSQLDVTLRRGEIVQLSGPNGAGKSTLLRTLAGFSHADEGRVEWRGVPDEIEPATLLHYHGHREGLREALTPRENLAFAGALLGGDEAKIEPALARLDAARLMDLPVQVLSAGQRRRVALARLLVAPRPVWLLDEPLAALDVAGQALVSELLADHVAKGGMALVATHQPLSVEVRHLKLGETPAKTEIVA
jgi:heme exporter protein A